MTDTTNAAEPDEHLSDEEAFERLEELRAEHHEVDDTNTDDLDEP